MDPGVWQLTGSNPIPADRVVAPSGRTASAIRCQFNVLPLPPVSATASTSPTRPSMWTSTSPTLSMCWSMRTYRMSSSSATASTGSSSPGWPSRCRSGVSQGALPSQSAAHRIPSAHAALLSDERAVPGADERLAADTSLTARVSPTRTAISGATRVVAACLPLTDLDHELRLVLAAMALQRRRALHATANFVLPDKQDVPASVRALARASVTHAEASPPAARAPHGPGC